MVNGLDVYRAGSIVASFNIDESTVFTEKLQGERTITCPVSAQDVLNIQEDDYIFYEGDKYLVNTIPSVEKDGSTSALKYDIVFEAEYYLLLDTYVKDFEGRTTFSYYGSPVDHLNLMVESANKNGVVWIVGEVDDLPEQNHDYAKSYVRTSLDEIAALFKLEWQITGKTIRMVKSIGRDTGLTFELGRGKGLHQIKRTPDSSRSVVTRAYGEGGTRNLPTKYRDGETTLIFEGRYVETSGVTAGTERAKEATYTNEKIYPHFRGNVVSTTLIRDAKGEVIGATITDPSIDFDVNDHLQEGVKPKVGFLTGPLTGQAEFEISKYDHATRTVTIIADKDANGYVLPNELNFPEVGNVFTFYDLNMPASYVVNSEMQLRTETLTWLNQNRFQGIVCEATPDPHHLRVNQIRLKAGDRATVNEPAFELSEILRFTEISYPLPSPYKVKAVISDRIQYNKVVKLFGDVLKNTQEVKDIDRRGQETAKRGAQSLRVLENSIFDVDGKFNSENLNLGVISALLGIFGLQSANFLLNRVFITANLNGDPNAVNISAGELFHLEYSNPGNQNIWQMQQAIATGLDPNQKYYVYSKLSKTSQVGSFLITTDQIKPNDLDGFYTVRTGMLYPVINGLRDADFTYGITTVNGRQIKAGEIRGNTNALIINLDTGEIFGKLTFRASDGTIRDVLSVDNAANKAQEDAATAQTNANTANTNATAAKTTADQAKAESASASKLLGDMASDSVLTPFEKNELLARWRAIQNEYTVRLTEAGTYVIDSSLYVTAYNHLGTFIPGLLANMAESSPINADNFKGSFDNYYLALVNLTKAISEKLKDIADKAQKDADSASTIANNAQSLANSKKRNFTVQPYAPYDVGDFWTDGKDLYRATTAKPAGGTFALSDWTKATEYDSTTVTIDRGIVTAGTIQLGNTGGVNAGITGSGTVGTDVRMWAGATFPNRDAAPFRVDQNGKLWATNAVIEGEIKATVGTIGGFIINSAGFVGLEGKKLIIRPDDGLTAYAGGYIDASAGRLVIPTVAPAIKTPGTIWLGEGISAGNPGEGGGSGGSSYLTGLLDVAITGAGVGQALVFNGTKWVNQNVVTDLSGYLAKSGGTMTGELNMDSNRFYTNINNYSFGMAADNNGDDFNAATNVRQHYHWGYQIETFDGTVTYAFDSRAGNVIVRGGYYIKRGVQNYPVYNAYDHPSSQQGTANSLAQRNGAGQLFSTYFNTGASLESNVFKVNRIYGGYDDDGYIRAFDQASVRTFLGLGSFAYRNSIQGNEVITSTENESADLQVSKYLRWKNYGNSHVIFDASQGTAPNGASISNTDSQNPWSGTYPTLMGWNGNQTYGVRVDASRISQNSYGWFGEKYNANQSTVNTYMLGYGPDSQWHPINVTDLNNFLGLTLQAVRNRAPELYQTDEGSRGYDRAAFQIRESNLKGGSGMAPRMSFHWAGIVASQFELEQSGRIAVRNNPGTGYENFAANYIQAYGHITAAQGTNGGFQNISYNPGHNNVWRLNDSQEYGMGYYQNVGQDYFGFHFGNRNAPVHTMDYAGNYKNNGGISINYGNVGHDPYGTIAVTRDQSNNWSYFGMTRNGAIGWGIGIATSNGFIIGRGSNGVGGAMSNANIDLSIDPGGWVAATNRFLAPIIHATRNLVIPTSRPSDVAPGSIWTT